VIDGTKKGTKGLPGSLKARHAAFMDTLDASSEKTQPGLLTGFHHLDSTFGGLRGLHVVGGLPGALKTSFALQLAVRVLQNEPNAGVVMFSAEMSASRSMLTLASIVGGVARKEIERGAFLVPALKSSRSNFREFCLRPGRRFVIRDSADDLTTASLASQVEEVRDAVGATRMFVIADSVQFLALRQPSSSRSTEKGRLEQVVACLAGISDDNTCVFAVSHLPKTATLRDARAFQFLGSAEFDYCADATLLMRATPTPKAKSFGRRGIAGPTTRTIELLIGKNRYNTPDTKIAFTAWPATGRFEEISEEAE